MENNRNYILAIGLSVLILVVWQIIYVNPKIEAEQAAQQALIEQQAASQTAQAVDADGSIPSVTAIGDAQLPGTENTAVNQVSRQEATASGDRLKIETSQLSGSLNLKGARLDDLILKNYRQNLAEDSNNVVLLSPAGTERGYFTEIGYVGASELGDLPGADTLWSVKSGDVLTPTSPITLFFENGTGLTFDRTISVDDNFMFTVNDSVTNANDAQISLSPYGRVKRLYMPEISGIYILHEGLIGYLGEEGGLQEVDYSDVESDGILNQVKTSIGWLGITDKYWATIMVPEQGRTFQSRFGYFANGTPSYQADFLSDPISVPSGGSAESQTYVYVGAKTAPEIDAYSTDLGIEQFDLMIDWGWFYFITKPMFYVLHYFYLLFGNFGVSILVTTVAVKLVFFPLANKSYKSMANMKKLQPKMEELKNRHGDDRQALQKAMMDLYKTEKVNPVAGCWPVLLQIPVFFALYKVLYVSIEMRHAPFFGWIQDLSAPDPTSLFNLFGLLPYDPSAVPVVGFLLAIGIWPIIMGITMFLQMRMNPTPPDPTQAMIFTWMPIVFTFMLATFPAGLVIYWAWNNSLSILQQGVIMKRQGVKIELWDNLRDLFKKKDVESDSK